jgi:hypothetical protein
MKQWTGNAKEEEDATGEDGKPKGTKESAWGRASRISDCQILHLQ